jgi:hypothetical protein
VTLLHTEGFDDLNGLTASQLYPYASNMSATGSFNGYPPRTGTRQGIDGSLGWRPAPAAEHATMIMGAAVLVEVSGTLTVMRFLSDAGATIHVTILLLPSGQVQATRAGTVLGTSAMAVPITPGSWHYIEAKATLSDTVGVVQIKVDEVLVVNLSGQDTKNGGTKTVFDRLDLGIGTGTSPHYDDLYICNGAGSVNNDFLGDCVVETLYPNGDGNYSVLVGSDGNSVSNYALVNETTPDTTSYVGSSTTGDKDSYAFGDLTHTSGTIKGVQTRILAAKTDAGARSFRSFARSAGTDSGGTDIPMSTTYTAYDEVRETDPGTAAAWTVSGVNAAEFGFEVRP